jgi:hypothetical protein
MQVTEAAVAIVENDTVVQDLAEGINTCAGGDERQPRANMPRLNAVHAYCTRWKGDRANHPLAAALTQRSARWQQRPQSVARSLSSSPSDGPTAVLSGMEAHDRGGW